jgi:hypothetical protein
MKPGDRVIVRDPYRARGHRGGWRWENMPGVIISVSSSGKYAQARVVTGSGHEWLSTFRTDRITLAEQ